MKNEIFNTDATEYMNTVAVANEKIKGNTPTRNGQRSRFMKYLSNLADVAGLTKWQVENTKQGNALAEVTKDIVINEDFDDENITEVEKKITDLIECNGAEFVENNINQLLGLE
jgi:hypothetical protein